MRFKDLKRVECKNYIGENIKHKNKLVEKLEFCDVACFYYFNVEHRMWSLK